MKPNILVVDDNEPNRMLLREILEPLHFGIVEADNGRRAVELVGDCRPALVLMDISMPVMDGLEATRQIRLLPGFGTLPVIAISAFDRDEVELEAFDAGCSHFLTKPVDFSLLVALVQPYRRSSASMNA